jgi:hypothetical protein
VEDVHRADLIPAILGELDRAGLLNHGVHTMHSPNTGTGTSSGGSVRIRQPPDPTSSRDRKGACFQAWPFRRISPQESYFNAHIARLATLSSILRRQLAIVAAHIAKSVADG